jgi:8-oxo-dGTP diphosphatase
MRRGGLLVAVTHAIRNVNGYLAPALTVDAVLLKGGEVLLIRRGGDPFRGAWAIPGGFVEVGERVEDAARRELVEETGLRGDIVDLLGVWSDPARDPRGHTVSVVFVCKVSGIVSVAAAGDDAAEARWFALDALPPDLAFDHAQILDAARRWLAAPGHFEKLGDTDFGKCA